jgi:heat shock protein HslJ
MMKAGLMMTRAAVMSGVALLMATSADAVELAGSEWRPVTIGGMHWEEPEAVVRFEGEGRLAGHSGCNRFAGTYALTGDTIEIGPLAATKMMCPEPIMAQERALFDALGSAHSYRREGTELTLIGAAGGTVFFVQTDWD